MTRQHFFIVSVFLVFSLALCGAIFAQRVIDLDKVWGDMRVLGVYEGNQAGGSVAYGDINGDGYMDIIVGIRTPGVGNGYVVFGSSDPASTLQPDIIIHDISTGPDTYRTVASGDVNGDGFDDIIIGSPYSTVSNRTQCGKTCVIFGSINPFLNYSLSTPDLAIFGDADYERSGFAVTSGDVNGDGFDDIIIGAPYACLPGRTFAGKTYVIFGEYFTPSTTIDLSTESADITVSGEKVSDYLGWAVASGDVNGDGYNDVIIGAYVADATTTVPPITVLTDSGKTYVILGEGFSTPPYTIDLSAQSADITVGGGHAADYSGSAVASGDINDDGFNEIIIGAPHASSPTHIYAGLAYVIYGESFSSPPYTIDLANQSADITVGGEYSNYYFGHAVTSGDVNRDGYDDIIIGAPYADSYTGEANVIFGDSFSSPPYTIDLSSTPAEITVCGDDAYDCSGCAVASGDVNNDGFDDIIIGANGADPGGRSAAGETYLILGGGAFITAHGLGGKSWIKEFSLLGRDWGSFKAFGGANSQGEVHLAIGDIDADSLDEIAAGQGEGAKSWVKFFEVNGSLISTFKAFGASNTNGELHLAIGNFDVDSSDNEIAIAQGEGGQSWVKVFETDGTFIKAFKAFGAANAQGEVHLAAIDLNADGIDEIAVAMGEGGVSSVKIFDSIWLNLIRSFRAFDAADNPGGEVRLAVGNFDADPDLEIAASTGYNGGNKIRLFDKDGTLIKQFLAFGFGGNPNGDVQIAAADIDNDGIWEIICAHGEGGSSVVKVFKADGTFIRSFKAFGAGNPQGEVHLGRSNY